jgi:hypothetical protein
MVQTLTVINGALREAVTSPKDKWASEKPLSAATTDGLRLELEVA